MRVALACAVVCVAAMANSPARACSIVIPQDYEGSLQQRRDVQVTLLRASAIIDGEVIRPWTANTPALVRVHHVLKGSVPATIQVGGAGAGADCSIALDRLGERRRMILSNGPQLYDLFDDGSQARLEDHLLKSDRRKVWPYYNGQPLMISKE